MIRRAARSAERLAMAIAGVSLFCGLACGAKRSDSTFESARNATAPDASTTDPLEPLRAFESMERTSADFSKQPPSNLVTGPNPIRIRRLPGTSEFVGLLRGRDAIVVLNPNLTERLRLPAPASPTGLALDESGGIFVSGEAAQDIHFYRQSGDSVAAVGRVHLEGVTAIADIAWGPEDVLYVVDAHSGRLITVPRVRERATSGQKQPPDRAVAPPASAIDIGHGPIRVQRVGPRVVVDTLLDHRISIFPVDRAGVPDPDGVVAIEHDGPMWSFDASWSSRGLLLVAGGIEDHPLDRRGGSFGYIDSFVFGYRVAPNALARPERLFELDVAEHGVVTPKVIALGAPRDGRIPVRVTGYGGERAVSLELRDDGALLGGAVEAWDFPPGSTAAVFLEDGGAVFANPLLDAWVRVSGKEIHYEHVPEIAPVPERRPRAKFGEALFFTSLMAPWNRSDGELSRFTCEACHFEGYVDGRTHHTGRGDVHTTTKPLLGLFNNRPHFSRALDPDLATVSHSEFRVAGARSDHDPWFSTDAGQHPWIRELGEGDGPFDAIDLRRALMAFLMDFTHTENPCVHGRTDFDDQERTGAAIFRDRCEGCHAARLASDASTAVPFERWAEYIFAPEGPLVWGKAEYEKTGVEPYVHPSGARVPSLRRLYKKWPYFTNGSAKNLDEVLSRARFASGRFWHAGGEGAALSSTERSALLAFLDLL